MREPAEHLADEATALLATLDRAGHTLALAESCTGGLAAASLVAVPGASRVFAGSAVVYQEATKTRWLGLPANFLDAAGVVSREVAEGMAARVLATTPHATLAGAITGHLGPTGDALEGTVWVAAAVRDAISVAERFTLAPGGRAERQAEAAAILLRSVRDLAERPAG